MSAHPSPPGQPDLWSTPSKRPNPRDSWGHTAALELPQPPKLSEAGRSIVAAAVQQDTAAVQQNTVVEAQPQPRIGKLSRKDVAKLERLAAMLETRDPTGAVPWPLILLEGGEKSGKTWQMLLLSASVHIGQMFLLDVGEGRSDEYKNIDGVSFKFVRHDGSLESIVRQVRAVHAWATLMADGGGKPTVLGIDSMTLIWELVKQYAADKARYTDTNKEKLAKNPNAEISIPGNAWDDAHDKRKELMHLLMTFPGIVVVTARGKEIAGVDERGHWTGKKTYKVEVHKDLPYDVSCHIRMFRDRDPVIVSAQSVHAGVQPEKHEPRVIADFSLERVIFDILKCNPATAHPRDLPVPVDRKYLMRQINTANHELGRNVEQLEADFQRYAGVASNMATLDQLAAYWDEMQIELAQLAEQQKPLLSTAHA